jgi:hypothetical protein
MPEQKMTRSDRATCICDICKELREYDSIPEPDTEYQKRINTEFVYWCDTETVNDLFSDDIWLIAKRTVAAQAEAIRAALTEMYDPFACHPAQPDPDSCYESQQRDIDRYLLEHGYIEPKTVTSTGNVVSSETQQESARINDSCVFCGASPFVWKGTCCASCGRSYRHG